MKKEPFSPFSNRTVTAIINKEHFNAYTTRGESTTMKKLVSLILAVAMVLCVLSFASAEETYRVVMITDSGDITDQSFNQTTYEACKAFCEENGLDFNYFKPTGDSDAERIAQVEAAIDEGYNVIVMPGYLFAAAIGECQPQYPDVKFIALDVSEYDLTPMVLI